MNKYVILSTDSTKEYYELLPLVCYSWSKLGYTPIVLEVINSKYDIKGGSVWGYCDNAIFECIQGIENVKNSTVAQVSRLFSYSLPFINDEDIVISGDADMVIGKDIFTDEADVVSYGHDLTGFGEIPICYVKATKKKWGELMQMPKDNNWTIDEIEKQLSQEAYSDKWEDYWSVDQRLLTQRAKDYGFDKIKFVNRGHDQSNSGLPQGRWDRYRWDVIPNDIIDVHIKRNDKEAQIKVFKTLFPNDDINWLLEYLKTI